MSINLEEEIECDEFEEDRRYNLDFAPRRFEPRYVRENILGRYISSLAKEFSPEGYNYSSMISAISKFERDLIKNPLKNKYIIKYLEFLKEQGFVYSP